jgi:hypothetical protein
MGDKVFFGVFFSKKVSIFSKGTSIAERGGSKRKELKS